MWENYCTPRAYMETSSYQFNMATTSTEVPTVRIKDLNKLNLVNLAYGGLVLGSSQFTLLSEMPQKMMPTSKVVKNDSKVIILLRQSKSMSDKLSL